jgi:4-hydroxy-3-methylbut-2-enyl diphosphate reductase
MMVLVSKFEVVLALSVFWVGGHSKDFAPQAQPEESALLNALVQRKTSRTQTSQALATLLFSTFGSQRMSAAGVAGNHFPANRRVLPARSDVKEKSDLDGVVKLEKIEPGTVEKVKLRKRIMSNKQFKRGANPFEKDIHKSVSEKMSETFSSGLVSDINEGSSLREVTKGEGNNAITFKLAKDYGFCWGVERSIELAWAARDAYPEKQMHITNELIHNPKVNNLLKDMDINFIEKTEQGKRFGDINEGDVVILPAFGATLEEMQMLDNQGVTVVDTTCPYVSKVWLVIDKHIRKDMTTVIHGKYNHEESQATASMAQNYIIVKNMKEAQEIADYIMGAEGALTDEELLEKYKHAVSKGFDPKKHLKRIGLANQTTMYKKETEAIGRLLEKAMIRRYGPEYAADNFASFNTICSATQVRQDAIMELSEPEVAKELDFILVIGGWDSSNTAHLLEIPHEAGVTGYHIHEPSDISPDGSITWRTVDGDIKTTPDFLPKDRPLRIGVTSGASTPDSVVQECLEQLVLLKKLSA